MDEHPLDWLTQKLTNAERARLFLVLRDAPDVIYRELPADCRANGAMTGNADGCFVTQWAEVLYKALGLQGNPYAAPNDPTSAMHEEFVQYNADQVTCACHQTHG